MTNAEKENGMQAVNSRVSMEEFVTNPFYLGKMTRRLSDDIRSKAIGADRQAQKHFVNHGDIGTGKTTLLQVMVCRMLYDISRQEENTSIYGVQVEYDPIIALMDHNLVLARQCLLDPIKDILKASPYFQMFKDTCSFNKEHFSFMNRVKVVIASLRSQHILELNVVGLFMEYHAGTVEVQNRILINNAIDRVLSCTDGGWVLGNSDSSYRLMSVPELPYLFVDESKG